jgi:hypothetical protein
MSRAYRVSVAESLRRHVQVEDGICSTLEILPLLDRDRMAELLAAELEKKGFERKGDLAVRTEADGIEVSVDLKTGEVTAKVTAEREVNLELRRSRAAAGPDTGGVEEARLRGEVQGELAAQAADEEAKLRQKVTAKLEGKLKDLRTELDGVVNRVTAEALKKKASELGTVEEISEDPETGSMTIKVRV